MDRLKNAFAPIINYFDDDEVIEIIINSNGSLWTDTLTSGLIEVGTVNYHDVDYLIRQVADYNNTVINYQNPRLECILPFNQERFSALKYIVKSPAVTIRKKPILIPLVNYIERGTLSAKQYEQILELVLSNKNIGIVGATSSGKSTLANSILDVIATNCPSQRMLIIEDTAELQYNNNNVEFFLTTNEFDLNYCLKSAMRFRPSRIIVGELRDGHTAWGLLKALNTGHSGGLFTLHANNCFDALNIRLPQLLTEVLTVKQDTIIKQTIDAIISIQKEDNIRKVQEIYLNK